jgi:hypothetical protein
LYERFGGQVAFFVVYIKEAHPEDGWVMTPNRAEGIRVVDAPSDDHRATTAGTCALGFHFRIPVLLDGIDNRVARLYGGWPDRLYLIGKDDRVAFQSGLGPWGSKPEDLEAAIQKELPKS